MSLPNIVFIILDTLRADRVLLKYNNKNLTPTIAKLLDNSICFKNCIANSTWTLPSHISMFTGLYPTQNKLLNIKEGQLNDKILLLTELLKNLGYSTRCYTENLFISKKFGLSRGFDYVLKNWKSGDDMWRVENYCFSRFFDIINNFDKKLELKLTSKMLLNIWHHIKFKIFRFMRKLNKLIFWKESIRYYKNNTIEGLQKFSEKLQGKNRDQPLYLFFNIMLNHYPYIPLKETFKDFNITLKDFRKLKSFMQTPYIKIRNSINIELKRINNREINIFTKMYNATAFNSDKIVKEIILMLKDLNILENSYLLISSDHGEHLFDKSDHYLWEHSTFQSVYSSVVKVPLLIYNRKFKKRIIDKQVQLKDLFHTILHITGVQNPKNKHLEIDKSIIYQIENNCTPKYIFGEYLKDKKFKSLRNYTLSSFYKGIIDKERVYKIFENIYFLRSNEYKYINYGNKIHELYDIIKDPFEQNNIIDKDNELVYTMKSYMETLLKKLRDPKEISEILTKSEKQTIDRVINKFQIKKI